MDFSAIGHLFKDKKGIIWSVIEDWGKDVTMLSENGQLLTKKFDDMISEFKQITESSLFKRIIYPKNEGESV